MGPKSRGTLHFESNMRTALVIKDGQLHRWSAAKPSVLGPGVPTPFSSMREAPSADGRSVMSSEGRLFDTGAWPPRLTSRAWPTPDGRFRATIRVWKKRRRAIRRGVASA